MKEEFIKGYILKSGWLNTNKVCKIKIYSINKNSFYPVEYEYYGRGYKGLRFRELLSNIEIVK